VNGKPMRLQEFEAFEKAIQTRIALNPNQSRLSKNLEEASSFLTNEELGRVADYIERKIINKKFSRHYLNPIFEEAVIA
jgi:hypothetical protein